MPTWAAHVTATKTLYQTIVKVYVYIINKRLTMILLCILFNDHRDYLLPMKPLVTCAR